MGSVAASTRMLGQYLLRRKLGEGAMGQAFLAHDQVLDRDVAIKVLRPEIARDEGRVREFIKEAQATARLNHPNIVTVYQAGRERGRVFIAMEYVQAGSLSDLLRTNGAMPWREATQAVRDACAGLQVAHEAGLVHRDVKPSNLMRTARGTIKVVDFGLARSDIADAEMTRTQPGTIMGSPGYMAPEQCRGERADARSDLYSLICTYYQLLTRQLPFSGHDIHAVMYQHCNEPFPDARAKVPELPEGVCRILARGSRKKPDERFAMAGELLAELEAVLATPEMSHVVATASAPSAKPLNKAHHKVNKAQRNRLRVTLVGAAAIPLIVASVGLLLQRRNAVKSGVPAADLSPRAALSSQATSPASTLLAASPGIVRSFAFNQPNPPSFVQVTPDGNRIIAGSNNHTVLLNARTGEELWGGYFAKLLPDGRRAIAESDGWKLINLVDGTKLAGVNDFRGGLAVVSLDGSRLVIHKSDNSGRILCVRCDLTKPGEMNRYNLPETKETLGEYSFTLSPDNKNLFAGNLWDGQTLYAWDAATGTELWHAGIKSGCERLTFSRDGKWLMRLAHASGTFLHDPRTGRLIMECETGSRPSDAALTSDSRYVIASYFPQESVGIRLFDLTTVDNGKVAWMKNVPAALDGFGVSAIALSPDDKRLLAACWDKKLRLLEIPSGHLLAAYAHEHRVTAVSFINDGRLAISGEEGSIHLWRLPD